MDKITDFFKELKDRLSNPLISSFIIAWVVINWKIVIGLFAYDNKELAIDGYKSYLDLISQNLTTSKGLWQPLVVALFYTFAFPFLRNCILAFNSWIKTWGSNWNLRLSKTGKVPIDKYIQLRDVYTQRTELLENVLEKESKFLKENEEIKTNNLKLIGEKNDLEAQIRRWVDNNKIEILNGEWEYTYNTSITKQKITNKIYISNGVITEIKNSLNDSRARYFIENFHLNPESSQLIFAKVPAKANEELIEIETIEATHFHSLQILKDFTVLKGWEDRKIEIEYKKVSSNHDF